MVFQPQHLDPSELGTKKYWDEYYQNDLSNHDGLDSDEDPKDRNDEPRGEHEHSDGEEKEDDEAEPLDPSDLDSWFDDVGAPKKILKFLTSTTFPLSPNYQSQSLAPKRRPTVLDLGTGNGSALFSLRLQGKYAGDMVGLDYSETSVELARKLWKQYDSNSQTQSLKPRNDSKEDDEIEGSMRFEVFDLIHSDPSGEEWWRATDNQRFDLVLDKGTFDAISLSAETTTVRNQGEGNSAREVRIGELYPSKVIPLVKIGGFLLVTSCNWTQEELIAWFTSEQLSEKLGIHTGKVEVYDTIQYPIFQFGGQKGQGVASVCFRRVS